MNAKNHRQSLKNSIGGLFILFALLQALAVYPIVSISHIIKKASEIMPIVTSIGINMSLTAFQ